MAIAVSIREYETSDKAAVMELLCLNTPHYFAPEEKDDLAYYLDHEIEQYVVVEQQQQLVGCGGINFADGGTAARISWDILHPDYQGQGIGTVLLNHRIAWVRTLPAVRTLSVRTSQLVYRFYEKSGFETVEVIKDYWAEGFDLYRMVYQGY